MKITVLNGSPKGMTSVTMQYIKYIQRERPECEWSIHNISQSVHKYAKDPAALRAVIADIRASGIVLWATPVYYLLVPSQYKRFIELLFDGGFEKAFRNRTAASLTTSIHFFDHTANNYLAAVSGDLGMKFAGSYSADMYDLVHRSERARLLAFFDDLVRTAETGLALPVRNAPIRFKRPVYRAGRPPQKIDAGNKKILILTDAADKNSNAWKMAQRFADCFSSPVGIANLNDIDTKGGCLGCCQCGLDNICSYEGKDGYIDFFRQRVAGADILVLAGTIRDRYLSWKFKQFFDRSFFNTHQPVMRKKQVGILISGPLSQVSNLRQVLEGYFEVNQANVVDFITDENVNSAGIDALIQGLALRLAGAAQRQQSRPMTFLGLGGRKIFRDDVYGRLRFVFQVDHKYFKKNGVYDFPQKDYKVRMLNALMMTITKIPPIRKVMRTSIKVEMIRPFQRLFKK